MIKKDLENEEKREKDGEEIESWGGEGGGGGDYDESDILTTPGVQHEMFEVRHW